MWAGIAGINKSDHANPVGAYVTTDPFFPLYEYKKSTNDGT